MQLQQATLAEYGSILAFYEDVIERTPGIAQYAQWHKGKHPTAEGLKPVASSAFSPIKMAGSTFTSSNYRY